MNLKRLVIANTILVIALVKLPSGGQAKSIEVAVDNTPVSIVTESKVTSRGDIRDIQAIATIEEAEPVATTYSQNCVELIKHYEGFRDIAYKLEGETNWTIGYGHSGGDVKEGQTISKEAAERLLIADIEGCCKFVLDQGLGLNQNELDALTSFTYNLNQSNLRKLVKGRSKEEIAEHIMAYTGSQSESNRKGLEKRRATELKLYKEGILDYE